MRNETEDKIVDLLRELNLQGEMRCSVGAGTLGPREFIFCDKDGVLVSPAELVGDEAALSWLQSMAARRKIEAIAEAKGLNAGAKDYGNGRRWWLAGKDNVLVSGRLGLDDQGALSWLQQQ